jgi:phosphohistidine phosphatase
MQVYLLRHGIAEDPQIGKSDADRKLTQEGRRRLRETLRVAANAEVKPSLILASPLVRAVETATIARDALRCSGEILQTKALVPNAQPEQVWDEIRAHRGETELLLVGHEPLFSQLAAYLLGAPALRIDFKKGALLRLDFDSVGLKPHGVLRWFLTSKLAHERAANVTKK